MKKVLNDNLNIIIAIYFTKLSSLSINANPFLGYLIKGKVVKATKDFRLDIDHKVSMLFQTGKLTTAIKRLKVNIYQP